MLTAAIWTPSPPVPVLERPPKAERVAVSSPELATLRSALEAIPNDTDPLDYDQWWAIIAAIHNATEGSDEGLALAHEFSSRSSKYDAEFLDSRVWCYLGVSSAEPITARRIFTTAEKYGWQDPTIADDFPNLGAGPVDTARFRPVRIADFATDKPMEWIIRDVLPKADIGMVFGASGSGKSFLLIDMACCVARGVPWRGKTVKKGRVCYVAAEGTAGFRKRIDAYCLHNGVDIGDLDLYIIADSPNLNEKAHVSELASGIKSAGPFDLLILDTLAAVSAGADENSVKEMGLILERTRAIGRAAGAMALIVHHAGKQAERGARGTSSIKARVDVEIEVVRVDNDRAATVSKLRDQEDGATFGFKLLSVPISMDDEGNTIDSCVVEHNITPSALGQKSARLGPAQRMMIDILRRLQSTSASGWVSSADWRQLAIEERAIRDSNNARQRFHEITRALETRGIVEVNGGLARITEEGGNV